MVYCIKKNGRLLIHTIAQWRRAAIVTYLIQDAKRSVFCTDNDKHVEQLWAGFADGATLVTVTISEINETERLREIEIAATDAKHVQNWEQDNARQ